MSLAAWFSGSVVLLAGLSVAAAQPLAPDPYAPDPAAEPAPPAEPAPAPVPTAGPPAPPPAPMPMPMAGPPAPPTAPERSGVYFGLGLGGGNLRVHDEADGPPEDFRSVAFELHLGGLITPRLGVGVMFAGSSHHEDFDPAGRSDITTYQNNFVAFAQYWVHERIWLRGGLGSATVGVSSNGETLAEFPGVGFLGAAAYEILSSVDYGLDLGLGLRAAAYEGDARSSTTGTFELSFTWY